MGIKLGYDYQSHLCTAFKRKYGVSPIEYRAMQHASSCFTQHNVQKYYIKR
ncbi:hypothetical protein [uncultured Prevotella sp.]|uniref:hypothetical protein n=1 Tax=uncultured Prevotella sp. TaxID=159272 RepID=UPI0035B3B241